VRAVLGIAVIAAVLIALFFGARRWIHHAQLELVPLIIPPGADVQAIIAPSGSAVAARMMRDVHDAVTAPERPRLAVLTFDDGPYPVETPALAAVLARLHAPADFFFIGNDSSRQVGIARRLAGAGFEVGNHSLTHPEMPLLAYDAQLAEVNGGAAAVRAATGRAPAYFRPPHGSFNADTLKAAGEAGEKVALWDVDPGDWRSLSADEIADLAIDQARAPAVILLHDGKDATIDALPRIVEAYRRAGFEFVTLSELERRVPLDQLDDPMKMKL
jgi:peptidoglycan/xylan/chitin deacetylase (PgdA/CDA1 family)